MSPPHSPLLSAMTKGTPKKLATQHLGRDMILSREISDCDHIGHYVIEVLKINNKQHFHQKNC